MKVLLINSVCGIGSTGRICTDPAQKFEAEGHEVNLIQKQYLDLPQYPQQFDKYFGKQLQVHNIKFEKKAKADLKARYLAVCLITDRLANG